MTHPERKMPFFERYLSLWVALCIGAGIGLGHFAGDAMQVLSGMEWHNVNLPVAVLIWLMIYPMMLQVDLSSIKGIGRKPKGILLTVIVNWLIKPFTMAFFAWIFFSKIYAAFISPDLAGEYIAGAILLGAAPCTAMVFVWSYLSKGDPNYTLVQVSVNDLIILVAFVPLVGLLLGITDVSIPYETLFASVVIFVLIPLAGGILTNKVLIKETWRNLVQRKLPSEIQAGFDNCLTAHARSAFCLSRKQYPQQPAHHFTHCYTPGLTDLFHFFPGMVGCTATKAATSYLCAGSTYRSQ
jgi:arsenite transporter